MSSHRLHIQIDGMSCGSCVSHVRKALERVPGVEVARVAVGGADVLVSSRSENAAIQQAIEDAGYEVTEIKSAASSEGFSKAESAPAPGGCCCGGDHHGNGNAFGRVHQPISSRER